MTMHAHDCNTIRLLQNGADGFISRTCNAKELQKALITLYYTGAYLDGVPQGSPARQLSNAAQFISSREKRLLALLCNDISYEDIAEQMGIPLSDVEALRDLLCAKLNVTGRIGLITSAYVMGIHNGESLP